MKTSLVSLRLPLALVWGLSGSLVSAQAAGFTFPGTVTASGAQWYLSDNITAFNPGSGGFGFTDAEFTDPAGGLDALDGGFVIRINGTHFASPVGSTVLNGNVLTSGTANYAGLNSQVEFRFDQTRPLVRALYSFTNPSQAPISASLSWEVNLGSDAGTVVRGTSGDSPNTAANRWLVTSGLANGGGPIMTLARFGLNAPHRPDNTPFWPGNTLGRADLLADGYNVSVQPGQTVRLMMFGWLGSVSGGFNDAVTTSIDGAAIFNDYAAMNQAGLFDGLPNWATIINWAVPEPSPATLLLLGLGLAAVRRKSRAGR